MSLIIYYEHKHGNMVSFILPLESTFLEARITQEDWEDFQFLKFKFEMFKLGSVFQPTFSLLFQFNICRQSATGSRRTQAICHLVIDVVPQERRRTATPLRRKMELLAKKTIKENPNGGKQGGIPEKEYPGSRIPKAIRTGAKQNQFRGARGEITTKIPAEVIPRYQLKQRGTPKRESPMSFTPKYNPSGHQKEINSQAPEEFLLQGTISTQSRVGAKRESLRSVGQRILRQRDKLMQRTTSTYIRIDKPAVDQKF